jgi:hypothetical protein
MASANYSREHELDNEIVEPINVVWAKMPKLPWFPAIMLDANKTYKIRHFCDRFKVKIASYPPAEMLELKKKNKYNFLVYVFGIEDW